MAQIVVVDDRAPLRALAGRQPPQGADDGPVSSKRVAARAI
jgi:hypothetical protein